MNSWHSFVLTVLMQVTAITVVAAIAMICLRRWAAWGHAIGVLSLLFVLVSPVLAVLLPRASWLERSNPPVLQNESSLISPPRVERPAPQRLRLPTRIWKVKCLWSRSGKWPHPKMRISPTYSEVADVHVDESKQSSLWRYCQRRSQYMAQRCFNLFGLVWVIGVVMLCRQFLAMQSQIRYLASSVQPMLDQSASC